MVPLIVGGLLLLALIYGPSLWVRRVMARYRTPEDRYPGTGAEFAGHLLKRLQLDHVRVESTEQGDHYDPMEKVVRLSPANHDGKHLTAVTVAAHEVGHALQDAIGYQPLMWRTRLAVFAAKAQRFGGFLLLAIPVLLILTRVPASAVMLLAAGLGSVGLAVLVHLITLPTEFDASFRRALPLLEAGYLKPEDEPAARRILTAAALTYVAAALMSVFNIWVWLRMLLR